MSAYLRKPFRSLTFDSWITMGAGGSVYAIDDNIAFKCAYVYDNPQPSQAKDIVESAEKAAHEQEMYRILMANPHPHILRGILLTPEGIFMERMVCTLHDRIKEPVRFPPPPNDLERRWILQLSSGIAWLETLGLAHGDLRPKNILLTSNDDIRVADFDVTRRVGEEVYTVIAPFGKMNPGWKHPIAGPGTEQFALASCIYNIRFGEEPMSDIDGPEMMKMLMRGELPPTPDDGELGELLADCWSEKFESMAAVDEKLRKLLGTEECVAPARNLVVAKCFWPTVIVSSRGRGSRRRGSRRNEDVLIKRLARSYLPLAPQAEQEPRIGEKFLLGLFDNPFVDVILDRPAAVPEIAEAASALLGSFGSSAAFLDVIFGLSEPEGKLPFDLPRSTQAVADSDEDVPYDTKDPVFRFGHGLRYAEQCLVVQ